MPATGNKSFRPLSLSIRLRADGFSFFVCDIQTAALIRGEHFRGDADTAQAIAEVLQRKEYSGSQIDQVYVLAQPPFCHVPLEHFRREEATAFYKLAVNSDTTVPPRVGYNILPSLEVAILYAIPADVEEVILQYFPTARFFASQAMLIERLAVNAESLRDDDSDALPLFVCIDDFQLSVHHFIPDATATETPRLHFTNTFNVATTDDALYFILAVWKALGLNATKDTVILLGQPSPLLQELHDALADYVINLRQIAADSLFPNISLAREREVPLDLMSLLLNRI